MKALLTRIGLASAFFVIPIHSVLAQYTWSVSLDQSDDTTSRNSPLLLACNGNHCTAIVNSGGKTGTTNNGVWYEFLRSDDGGLSWTRQLRIPDSGSVGYFVFALQQIDSLNVVAVGDNGHIFRTSDGGATWRTQLSPAPYQHASLWGVHFADSLNGIIGIPDRPMVTSDGGSHWALGPYIGLGSQNCHCYGPGKFAVLNGSTGKIYRTNDNWGSIDSTPAISDSIVSYFDLRRSQWEGNNTVIGYGYSGTSGGIVLTRDGGLTWNIAPLPSGESISAMSEVSDDTLFAGRSDFALNSFLFSSDFGLSWAKDSLVVMASGGPFKFDAVTSIARPSPGVVLATVQAFPSHLAPGLILRGQESHSQVKTDGDVATTASVWPSPARGTVELRGVNLEAIRICDPLGRMYECLHIGNVLDVSPLPSGVYFLSDGHTCAKFVKE